MLGREVWAAVGETAPRPGANGREAKKKGPGRVRAGGRRGAIAGPAAVDSCTPNVRPNKAPKQGPETRPRKYGWHDGSLDIVPTLSHRPMRRPAGGCWGLVPPQTLKRNVGAIRNTHLRLLHAIFHRRWLKIVSAQLGCDEAAAGYCLVAKIGIWNYNFFFCRFFSYTQSPPQFSGYLGGATWIGFSLSTIITRFFSISYIA